MTESMEYVKQSLIKLLSIDSPSGFTRLAAEFVRDELTNMGYSAVMTKKGGVLADLGGCGSEPGILIGAHIDTLGAMVHEVKDNGRLRITPIGGLNANNCETENCRVYTRFNGVCTGTLQLCNPSIHVNGEYNDTKRSFDTTEVVLDEITSSAEQTKKLGICAGDVVCFDPRTVITEKGYIKSRFLDDKLSAAIILGFAKQLKLSGKTPKRHTYAHFTVYEEVGHGASATVPDDVGDVLSVDMGCVGDGIACDERKVSICAKDSAGPYNYDMVTELVNAAKKSGAEYCIDIYPHYSSDADVTVSSGHDLRHGLIGAGVYASHGYERSHLDGAENTLKLLWGYLTEE